jgi:hypothetical protein
MELFISSQDALCFDLMLAKASTKVVLELSMNAWTPFKIQSAS